MLRFNRLAVLVSLIVALGVNAQNVGPARSVPLVSSLDAPLFYQLLMGELNARGGDDAAAYALMLDAARVHSWKHARPLRQSCRIVCSDGSPPRALYPDDSHCVGDDTSPFSSLHPRS